MKFENCKLRFQFLVLAFHFRRNNLYFVETTRGFFSARVFILFKRLISRSMNTDSKELNETASDAKGKTTKPAGKSPVRLYLISAIVLVGLVVGGYFLYAKWAKEREERANNIRTGELVQAYTRLYDAVKSKDTEKIKAVMSQNSMGLAEFASSQQKKPIEEVLKNGFTATTFAEKLPKMRDERFQGEFGALEVYNEKTKKYEDLPFIAEDGVWKFAMGDLFRGSYQRPEPGMQVKEDEAANVNNPNLIPLMPPNGNINAAPGITNGNVNTVQVEPIKPLKKRKGPK